MYFTAVRLVLSSYIQGCYGGHNYHYFTRIASDLSIYSDGRGMTRDSVDAFIVSLEFCYVVSTISTAYTIPSEGPGRPTLFISQEQLTFLVESNFTVPKIANILGVSIRTIRRRMTEYGLSIRLQYSTICDQELDSVVASIQE